MKRRHSSDARWRESGRGLLVSGRTRNGKRGYREFQGRREIMPLLERS